MTGIPGCSCGCLEGPQCDATDGYLRCMSTAGHTEDHDFESARTYLEDTKRMMRDG